MREIGVYVCNYNKRDMVAECVRHLLDQTIRDKFDIYVVDNASTDGSVDNLVNLYGEEITVLQNEENVGGAGGFGRGIREAVDKGYKYLMLVDNDAMIDTGAVEILYNYLEDNDDVGICGAKTVKLQKPDEIQDMGGYIDQFNYGWSGIMQNKSSGNTDFVMDVDYVASCSCMARISAVREFGFFPEENFIYWDDAEWCTKCNRSGYRVVVNGKAVTRHDFSQSGIENQFFRYYSNRNRYRFFSKYLEDSKLEDFWNKITDEVYTRICTFRIKGMDEIAQVVLYSFEDYLNGVTGRMDARIIPFNKKETALEKKIKNCSKVMICMPDHVRESFDRMEKIIRYIKDVDSKADIYVAQKSTDEIAEEKDTLSIVICNHVREISKNILPAVYIDGWLNFVADQETYDLFSDFDNGLASFRLKYRSLFDDRIKQIRSTV